MKKIGVVLSGCGVYDGSEIHEAVLTMLSIDRRGAEIVCMAPDIQQMHVINHLKGEPVPGESRNVLAESARIARGKIKNIKDVKACDIDALIFPGGFGAAKNLCDFAINGENCTANDEVIRLTREMRKEGKPIGAICIAPALAAKIFEGTGIKPRLTIGNDEGTAEKINLMGACHQTCSVTETCVDRENKIVSNPAYMLAGNMADLAEGIDNLVEDVISLI